MEAAREPARPAPPERDAAPAPPGAAPRVGGNAHGTAWAAVARHVALHAGNRATLALLRAPPKTTADMHEEIYGDSALAHQTPPEPKYEFSDPDEVLDPGPGSIRVQPGPVRATLIKPKLPDPPSREWIQEHLKKDPILKALPDWARDAAIDALKDADEIAAEKIIDALPWEAKTKEMATAAIKTVLQQLKGRTMKIPPAPPATRTPEWQNLPEQPSVPGTTIFTLPPVKW
jgi:hypothetical protein